MSEGDRQAPAGQGGIFHQGYRRYEGARLGRFFRWLTIARAGVTLSGRSKWLRRFVYVAWLPLLYYGFFFFVVGQLTEARTIEQAEDMWQFQVARNVFGGPLAERFIEDPGSFRPVIWGLLIHLFLRYTQVFCVMIVVAVVGPRLVCDDLRSRALALYFSKPLTRFDYLAGKLAVVAFWVGMVTLAPALALYALSIVFSPTIDTLAQTIGLIPRLVAFSAVVMVGTGAPMLALSSLTPNPRFLGFVWAGLWVMSGVAATVLSTTLYPAFGPSAGADGDWTGLVSVSHNFHAVGFRLFDLGERLAPLTEVSPSAAQLLDQLEPGHDWTWSLGLILATAALSLVVVALRIGRPGEAGAR